MTFQYKPITQTFAKTRTRFVKLLNFFFPDSPKFNIYSVNFKTEESNKIIETLVSKIEQYEQARNIKTNYERFMDNHGKEKIVRANIESGDNILKGTIDYSPPCKGGLRGLLVGGESSAKITAKFNFNSQYEADKEEYLRLVDIIKTM